MNNEQLSERVAKIETRQEIMDFTIKSLLESIKEAQRTQAKAQEKNEKIQARLSYAVMIVAMGTPAYQVLAKMLMGV